MSEFRQIRNFTGFGLYDHEVMETLREIDDPYPYFRGLICDLGYARVEIPYTQPSRRRGITKNNFYSLYDMAMLGITNHSKVPLRLAAMAGFVLSIVALLIALAYLLLKLGLVGHVQSRPGAIGDRRLLLRQRAAVLHRDPR